MRVTICPTGARASLAAMRAGAIECEARGADGISLADHIGHPPGRGMIDVFALAHAVAQVTTHLNITIGVAALTFREPAILAKMATGLSLASGGRLILGIGTGVRQGEHDMFGIRFPPPGERVARLEEYVQVVKMLCQPTGEPVDFEGQFYRLRAARNLPPPPATIPIMIGGAGDRVLGVVARHADLWDITDTYLDRVAERSVKLDEALARTGRAVRRSITIPIAVTPPTREQLAANRESLALGAFGDRDTMLERIHALTRQGHFDEVGLAVMGGRDSFDRAMDLVPALRAFTAEPPAATSVLA